MRVHRRDGFDKNARGRCIFTCTIRRGICSMTHHMRDYLLSNICAAELLYREIDGQN